MVDLRTLLEQGYADATPPPDGYERMLHRRDRKRRNQRIKAGVVGLAVFIVAVWIVTSVKSLDRSETSVGPAGSGTTGPAETGPTFTQPGTGGHLEPGESFGPAETGDSWVELGPPEYDLPPEAAAPSTPKEGKVVDKYTTCCPSAWVYVYADGRVISWRNSFTATSGVFRQFEERRLTPKGVELVRSGTLQARDILDATDGRLPELPAGAWEVPTARPYVPSRYSVCFELDTGHADPSTLVRFFPARARAILDEVTDGCAEVTTDEARALFDILGTMSSFEQPTPDMVRVEDSEGREIYWNIRMMLPHGSGYPCPLCG